MGSTSAESIPGRRAEERRRQHHLLATWRWAYRGRRKAARRTGDGSDGQLDWHHPGLLVVCIAILFLSSVDATITLALLQTGSTDEINPFMRFVIEHDVQTAVNLKTALTAAALVFLVACSNSLFLRRVRVKWILSGVLGMYIALVGYEFHLLMRAGQL